MKRRSDKGSADDGRAPPQSAGIRQTMRLLTVSLVGCPLLSWAGVKRAREMSRRQVAASSAAEPLDEVTWQPGTRPFGPPSRRKPVVPDSLLRSADAG